MSSTIKTGYVILGPAYEYNDSGYDVVGDHTLTTDKVFLTREEAEDRCKQIWIDTWKSLSEDSYYSSYTPWRKSDLPHLNRELFSIDSKIYIQDSHSKIPGPLSDLEYTVLKKYWSGPKIAYVKEVPIG